MSHRRLHILVALLCTGLWAGAIWLGHTSGHLRFLDRLESALSDVRTLARGVKAPPDLVTIVAIDDTIVKLGGTYPLPRAEIAKIVEAIARLEPKVIAIDLLLVDKGPADGDAALAKSLAAQSDRAGGGGGIFEHRSAFRRGRRAAGPPAEGRPLPAAAPGICRPRGSRHRQCDDGPDRHAAVGPDAVPDTRQDRIVVSASCRICRDRQAADDRARPPAVRRPADRDRFRLCAADFLLRPAPHHSHRQRRKSDRRPDRQGGHSGPDRRPRRDRNRRRRLLSDAVRFTDAGRGNHFHRDHASGRRGRRGARPAGSHRRGHHDDPASDAAGRFAGVAAKRDRSARRSAR